ncbi:MAG: MgtC/SapB family protein [Desulfuromusa sp.]|nr:MgtC/SapB family protein [Desulfuromusa sp.]
MNYLDIVSNDGIYVARLLVAVVLGGLVGIERQSRGRSAGLRTNILVCLGSAAIIVVFQKLAIEMNLDAESAIRMDPARAAAGVITGIGFLGAGTIVKSRDFVRGLTTAASIWVVSALGVTIGLGEYVIAVTLTLLILLTLFALHYIPIRTDHYSSLSLDWHGDLTLLSEVKKQLIQDGMHINKCDVTRQPNTGKCRAILSVRFRNQNLDGIMFERLQSDIRLDEITWS